MLDGETDDQRCDNEGGEDHGAGKEGYQHAVGLENPDEACDLDYCPNKNYEQEVRAALSNSLGFGGHNATLCFVKAE